MVGSLLNDHNTKILMKRLNNKEKFIDQLLIGGRSLKENSSIINCNISSDFIQIVLNIQTLSCQRTKFPIQWKKIYFIRNILNPSS